MSGCKLDQSVVEAGRVNTFKQRLQSHGNNKTSWIDVRKVLGRIWSLLLVRSYQLNNQVNFWSVSSSSQAGCKIELNVLRRRLALAAISKLWHWHLSYVTLRYEAWFYVVICDYVMIHVRMSLIRRFREYIADLRLTTENWKLRRYVVCDDG